MRYVTVIALACLFVACKKEDNDCHTCLLYEMGEYSGTHMGVSQYKDSVVVKNEQVCGLNDSTAYEYEVTHSLSGWGGTKYSRMHCQR